MDFRSVRSGNSSSCPWLKYQDGRCHLQCPPQVCDGKARFIVFHENMTNNAEHLIQYICLDKLGHGRVFRK